MSKSQVVPVLCIALLSTVLAVSFVAVEEAAAPSLGSRMLRFGLPPLLSQKLDSLLAAAPPLRFPPTLSRLSLPLLRGAVSAVVIGQGLRPAGGPPETREAAERPVPLLLSHATEKLLYAVGAALAEWILLKIIQREPYRNLRRNRWNHFFSTACGGMLLVLLTAVPNRLVNTSLVCILVLRLSASVYGPTLVLGHLLRSYLISLVPLSSSLPATYAAIMEAYFGGTGAATPVARMTEVCFECGLLLLFLGSVAFWRMAQNETPVSESDGDDYYGDDEDVTRKG